MSGVYLDLRFAWNVMVSLMSVLAAVLSIVALRARKEGVSDTVVKQLSTRMEGVEETLQAIEREVASMPTRVDALSTREDISKMRGEIGKIGGRVDGIARAVDLFNQHLINKG